MISRRIPYLRAFCNEFRAAAPDSFWDASDVELAQAFNGERIFCTDVYITFVSADSAGADHHAFEDAMRIAFQ